MNLLLLAAGLVVLAVALVDALWTTLWVAGRAGPLSRIVIAGPQRTARRLAGPGRDRILGIMGPVSLVGTVTVWMLLVWTGWALVFLADAAALVRAPGEPVTSPWDAIYYAGFTVFSLGTGDVRPATPAWQIATVIAVANGVFLLTLAVTYVINVISSVVAKRDFATEVMSVGDTPASFVVAVWSGGGRETTIGYLTSLARAVNVLAERHRAYPILHAYHAPDAVRTSSLAIAVLDEALTIAEYGLRDEVRPDALLVKRLRASIGFYLESGEGASAGPADVTPPPPSLRPLRDAGVPVVDDAEFEMRVSALDDRRRRLAGLLHETAWRWDAITRE